MRWPAILLLVARLLAFLILVLAVIVVADLAGMASDPGARFALAEPGPSLVRSSVQIAGTIALVWLFRRRIDKRPWTGMALPAPQWGRFFMGFAAGGALLLLIGGLQVAFGSVRPIGSEFAQTGAFVAAGYIAGGLFFMLGVSFCEELGTRGYLFQTLGERMPIWAAVLVSGAIFGAQHIGNPGFGWTFALSAIIVTAIFVALRLVTGSLWFPIGFHEAWNWAQSNLLGISNVNDRAEDHAVVEVAQGGPALWTGVAPSIEGGLLVILVETVLLVLLLVHARRRGLDWRGRMAVEGRPPTGAD